MPRLTEDQREDVVKQYQAGRSMGAIAKDKGVCHTTILKILEQRGIPRRPLTVACRRAFKKTPEQLKETKKRLRLEREKAGLCLLCGNHPPEPNRQYCVECREDQKARSQAHYLKRSSAGRCQHCGDTMPKERRGKTMCDKCVFKKRRNGRKRRQQGLCSSCGRPSGERALCPRCLSYSANWRRKLRQEVITAYGGKCTCCGETAYEFLNIDHVNGGGNKHRRQVGYGNVLSWLKRHNFPPGYQVLCYNCNCSRAHHGMCPHQRKAQV